MADQKDITRAFEVISANIEPEIKDTPLSRAAVLLAETVVQDIHRIADALELIAQNINSWDMR